MLEGVAVGLLTHWMSDSWHLGTLSRRIALLAVLQAACLVVSAYLVVRMASAEAVPFVYFQF